MAKLNKLTKQKKFFQSQEVKVKLCSCQKAMEKLFQIVKMSQVVVNKFTFIKKFFIIKINIGNNSDIIGGRSRIIRRRIEIIISEDANESIRLVAVNSSFSPFFVPIIRQVARKNFSNAINRNAAIKIAETLIQNFRSANSVAKFNAIKSNRAVRIFDNSRIVRI